MIFYKVLFRSDTEWGFFVVFEKKVGKVRAVGGQIVTVDEGNLDLKIKMAG